MQPKKSAPLWLILAVGLVAIALQVPKSIPLAALGLVLIIGTCALRERGALRYMGSLRFWLIGFFIAAASGLFLGKKHDVYYGIPISLEGFRIGVLITLRAGIFVTLIMTLSRKVSPDFFVRSFGRLGLPQTGAALALGVKLLPEMMKGWQAGFSGRKKGGFSARLAGMVAYASHLADEIARDSDAWMASRATAWIFTVTGPKGSGKSDFMREIAEGLHSAGIPPGGFFQPSVREGERRIGYDLVPLPDGSALPLARRSEGSKEDRWVFDERAFTDASDHLNSQDDRRVWLIDEIGLLEHSGGGHWPVLARTLPKRGGIWVLCIREGLVSTSVSRLGYAKYEALTLPSSPSVRAVFIQSILTRATSEET